MSKVRRVLSVVCLVLFLGLPLAAAQTERETVSPIARFLELVWERLSAPLAPLAPTSAIWQADEGDEEETEPQPGEDTGGSWDPFG